MWHLPDMAMNTLELRYVSSCFFRITTCLLPRLVSATSGTSPFETLKQTHDWSMTGSGHLKQTPQTNHNHTTYSRCWSSARSSTPPCGRTSWHAGEPPGSREQLFARSVRKPRIRKARIPESKFLTKRLPTDLGISPQPKICYVIPPTPPHPTHPISP